jgi:hypothetical protein
MPKHSDDQRSRPITPDDPLCGGDGNMDENGQPRLNGFRELTEAERDPKKPPLPYESGEWDSYDRDRRAISGWQHSLGKSSARIRGYLRNPLQ